jgi:hypothetical protein
MAYKVKLFSYVLMDNHFHLLIETPLGNLSEFMRQFNITYTSYSADTNASGTFIKAGTRAYW